LFRQELPVKFGKTLTDKEIDGWMSKIMTSLEKELQAEIRK